MKKILLFLILLWSNLIFAQKIIYPEISRDLVTDLQFINADEVIFINESGSVYKSIDGGNEWELKKHLQGEKLTNIYFIDDKVGFIYSKNSFGKVSNFFYTNDSGESWYESSIKLFNDYIVYPLSENIMIKSNSMGEIQFLNNFYNSWETVFRLPFSEVDGECGITAPTGQITKFHRVTDENILALGVGGGFYFGSNLDSNSFILKSSDLGNSWDTLSIIQNSFIDQITFHDTLHGWLSGNNELYKTSNGGTTWTLCNLGEIYIRDIMAKDSSFLMTIQKNGQCFVYKSSDYGNSWTETLYDFYSPNISAFDAEKFILYGDQLALTTDGGQSWALKLNSIKDDIYDVDFYNESEGIAVGFNNVYKTTDGGKSWKHIQKLKNVIQYYSNRTKVYMIDENEGWIISYDKYYHTQDGGETWKSQLKELDEYFISSYFNEDQGLIISKKEVSGNDDEYKIMLKKSDKPWKKLEYDFTLGTIPIKSIQFNKLNDIYILNYEGLWNSKDTAKTWTRVFNDVIENINSFKFFDENFGVATNASNIYITIDGGISWQFYEREIDNSKSRIEILNPDIFNRYRVLEVCESGKIYSYTITEDGELNFQRSLKTFTNNAIYAIEVHMKDDFPLVWCAGDNFNIWFREFEKSIATDIEGTDLPTKYSLSQNYPNPFNPSTTIEYTIPNNVGTLRATSLQINVYNILGKKIKTLYNGTAKPGSHKIKFDGTDLPSGTYFVQMTCGDYRETIKALLVK